MHSHLQSQPALIEAVRRLERLNPDQFELYLVRKTIREFSSDGVLTPREQNGISVRLLKDRRMGIGFATSLDLDAIRKAVTAAAEMAQRQADEDPHAGLFSFGEAVYPEVDAYDPKGLAASDEQKLAIARGMSAAGANATLVETAQEIHLVDSSGEHIQHRSTVFSARAECAGSVDFAFSNYLDNLDAQAVARQAAQLAAEKQGAGPAPSGRMPVVLRNRVVARLLERLAPGFSAAEVTSGRSWLSGRQGERLFSESITILNDGLLPGGYATAPFDAEGVPSTTVKLVDGGFVSGALYDRYHAAKLGQEPTSSATRDLAGPPSIGISNLYLAKGRKKPESLLDGIARGLLVTDIDERFSLDLATGAFTFIGSGLDIEAGRASRPVKGFVVSGHAIDLFRRVTDLASDLRFFGAVGAPSVRVSELAIG